MFYYIISVMDCLRVKKLQRVQNAAARLIFDARKKDHITPLLRDLHWLPVRRRIDYKLLSLVYKCLHDAAPEYLWHVAYQWQTYLVDVIYAQLLASWWLFHAPKRRLVRLHSVYLGHRNRTHYRSIFGIQNCRMTAFRRHWKLFYLIARITSC